MSDGSQGVEASRPAVSVHDLNLPVSIFAADTEALENSRIAGAEYLQAVCPIQGANETNPLCAERTCIVPNNNHYDNDMPETH